MVLLQDERNANDMMKTGKFCWTGDKQELEQVTGETRYTCHYCGAVYEEIFKDGVLTNIEVHFEGH